MFEGVESLIESSFEMEGWKDGNKEMCLAGKRDSPVPPIGINKQVQTHSKTFNGYRLEEMMKGFTGRERDAVLMDGILLCLHKTI